MTTKTEKIRQPDTVTQFSVFVANRLGRLHDLIKLFSSHAVHALGITILDTTESSIIRLVVDDPEKARALLKENDFAFTESELVCVAIDSAAQLNELAASLLESELNINYMYSLIPQSQGKPILAISMEDNEMAEKLLAQHSFRVLRQADISR